MVVTNGLRDEWVQKKGPTLIRRYWCRRGGKTYGKVAKGDIGSSGRWKIIRKDKSVEKKVPAV